MRSMGKASRWPEVRSKKRLHANVVERLGSVINTSGAASLEPEILIFDSTCESTAVQCLHLPPTYPACHRTDIRSKQLPQSPSSSPDNRCSANRPPHPPPQRIPRLTTSTSTPTDCPSNLRQMLHTPIILGGLFQRVTGKFRDSIVIDVKTHFRLSSNRVDRTPAFSVTSWPLPLSYSVKCFPGTSTSGSFLVTILYVTSTSLYTHTVFRPHPFVLWLHLAGLLTTSYDILHPYATLVGTMRYCGGLDGEMRYHKVEYDGLCFCSKSAPNATLSPDWGFIPTSLQIVAGTLHGGKKVRDVTTVEYFTVH
ncbi:hypothetical protein BDQ17DRAFT_1438514 [Cyathus striatus]|nr:hypothetical protein BDQ17DRAFT_1438514 [Cyathus striatus]